MNQEQEKVLMCLEKAKAKLGPNGENWTKEAYARNKLGIKILSSDPNAVKFCALGAIRAAKCEPQVQTKAQITLNRVAMEIGAESIVDLNDDAKSFKEILDVYDAAISELKDQKE